MTSEHDQHTNTDPSPMIWDLPLRLFHWALVGVVSLAAITGYFFEDWWLDIHVYAGYSLTCLLAFRLVWGFIGSPFSRFSRFPLARKQVGDHLKSLLKFKSEPHSGHNPVGAWMIVILLSTLFLLVLSGLITWGGQENNGPLADWFGYQVGHFTGEIHETLAGILMACVGIHIGGVLFETIILRYPLIKAMITGRKDIASPQKGANHWHSLLGGVVFLVICAGFIGWIKTTSQTAYLGKANATYTQECGDCHMAYHPSMRTKENWQTILQNLENHYGEDASLDNESLRQISQYLNQNNAQSFDTEASFKIGRTDTASARMTDTPYWKKKHRKFSEDVFRLPNVGSKVNCKACHMDAETGRYDDAKIKLPNGVTS